MTARRGRVDPRCPLMGLRILGVQSDKVTRVGRRVGRPAGIDPYAADALRNSCRPALPTSMIYSARRNASGASSMRPVARHTASRSTWAFP